ncbi:unnamed protein product [Arctia plantaginis]|uniref:Serine carboxypeptidase n=1 Tax=Arctia plantaginis TaxID=874455 RepID=A0A8S0Z4G3_ARCPL|nr:unnamed protein product [Arctia plantaginis]
MNVFLLLVSFLSSSWGLEQRIFVKDTIHQEMDPPETMSLSRSNVMINWIEMPLDHFDPQNTATFNMRYMFNEEHFGGAGSPIFIMAGGEWTITTNMLMEGNMYDMAVENKGYLIYTEHRYYGQTIPFTDFTANNLRFLNIDQALADLAYFIKYLKKQPRFANSKIIMYGGSYAANMVMWFKQRYPHLVLGVVASSGPINAKIDFAGYLEVVHEAFLLEGGEQCIDIIRQGIQDTVEALETEADRRTIEESYRLCNGTFDFDNRLDLGYFAGMITWTFSGRVQYAVPGSLLTICNNFRNNVYGTTPMMQIGGFVALFQNLNNNSCWNIKFDNMVANYMRPTNSRAWYYQTCTEYGYFQIAPNSGTVFDPLKWLDVEFYVEVCKRGYDERFDEAFAYDAADRVNLIFGALSPEVKNTINIHGYIDPWRALGVYERDLHVTSPTYTVPRASHCFDISAWRVTDTIQMTAVQQRARSIVASWLNS